MLVSFIILPMIKLLHLICVVVPIVEATEVRQTFFYGSASFSPGSGISIRKRADSKGSAIDLGMGFGFDFFHAYKRFSADYNWMWFVAKEKQNSLYCSCGVGGQVLDIHQGFFVYVPLRAGYQMKYGFVDVGINMFGGIFPTPEARVGIGFEF
jgi:hypothetical protein